MADEREALRRGIAIAIKTRFVANLIDAVMSVRDEEVARLRTELAEAQRDNGSLLGQLGAAQGLLVEFRDARKQRDLLAWLHAEAVWHRDQARQAASFAFDPGTAEEGQRDG